jgi:hypothetical protein
MIQVDQEKLAQLQKYGNNKRIVSHIEELEQKLIRPMTAMINNTATDSDRAKFNEIKTEIAMLRAKLL